MRPHNFAAALLCICTSLLCGCTTPQPISFKKLSYPMPVSHVVVDGVEVAFSDVGVSDGNRATLVLIHGLGSYMPVWTHNLDELAADSRVIAIDLPGYGKSSKANYEYSMAFYARVVDRLIDALHLQHVVLVGHSMGGQIAMTHALRYPGRAEGLVLIAPAGFETFGPGEGGWLATVVTKEFVMVTPTDAIVNNLATNFFTMPRSASWFTRASPRPSMFITPREAKCNIDSRSLAGQLALTQRWSASPSARTTCPPHSGQRLGKRIGFSSLPCLTTSTTLGMTSPPRSTLTVSPR